MTKENGINKHVWEIMVILSITFIVWALFVFSKGDTILETAIKLAGSPLVTGYIEKAALGFQSIAMSEPLWEGIWIGIRIILFFWI